MITDLNIFFNSKERLIVSLPQDCLNCGLLVTDLGFLVQKYSKSKNIPNKIIFCCTKCESKVKEDKILYTHMEGNIVTIVSSIKTTWPKIFFQTPTYKNSKNDLSVYEASDEQIGDETIIDHTVFSGKKEKSLGYKDKKLLGEAD